MNKHYTSTINPYFILISRYIAIPVLIVLFVFFANLTGNAESSKKGPNRIKNITYNSTGKNEKITILLQKDISYRACFLDHNPKQKLPYRLYLDLHDTTIGKKVNKDDIYCNISSITSQNYSC